MSNELANLKDIMGDGALVPVSEEQKAALDRLSQSASFLSRIQLYTRGKPIDKGIIAGGHFGIPRQGDEIEDLGTTVDLLVLGRKPKALDMSDKDNLIETNDPTSDEFKRIEHLADNVKDSGCVYGPSYLMFERTTGLFYEFFCGNKSARIESARINLYLPENNGGVPKPMTLKAVLVENARFSWHVPKAEDCLTPFDKLFNKEQLDRAVELFTKAPDSSEVETVETRTGRKR